MKTHPQDSADTLNNFKTDHTKNDDLLGRWLQNNYTKKQAVVLIHSNSLCKFASEFDGIAFMADPDKNSHKKLTSLAKNGLLKTLELSLEEFKSLKVLNSGASYKIATKDNVSDWVNNRKELLGLGRGKNISTNTAETVWADAVGRCMYKGCGKNLSSIRLSNKSARVAYLAHIIASSPKGPRGDINTSHKLSDDPDNIMLMCDEHHRLIDRVDVLGHPTTRLQTMRKEHKKKVNKLLDSLSHPDALPITLLGNLANAPTHVSDREVREAILQRSLCPLPDIHNAIRRTQRDHRNTSQFWEHLLDEHKPDIEYFLNKYGGKSSDPDVQNADALAFFPLTLTSIMVLAGRIVGEARAIEVFQYDRQRKSWQWDNDKSSQPGDFFYFDSFGGNKSEEILLSIEITSFIDKTKLPEELSLKLLNNNIPWIRVKAREPNPFCIKRSDDLDQFTSVARKAIHYIQDTIRPAKIHLIVISPSSTVFRLGQLLQAGHHPEYVVYDRPDFKHPFRPALSIHGQYVSAVGDPVNEKTATIQLR